MEARTSVATALPGVPTMHQALLDHPGLKRNPICPQLAHLRFGRRARCFSLTLKYSSSRRRRARETESKVSMALPNRSGVATINSLG